MNHEGHKGHEGLRRVLPLVCLGALLSHAQTPRPVEVVPVDKEPAHKLVFENEYVRVFSVEVAPHSETKYHQHDRDYVWVSLGDSDVESVRVGAPAVSVKPKDGEAQFTKGGFAHKAVNKSDKPFRNVTVELKKVGLEGIGFLGCRVSPRGVMGCEGFSNLSRDPKPNNKAVQGTSYALSPGGPFVYERANADFGLIVFLSDGRLGDKNGKLIAVSSGTFIPITAADTQEYRNTGSTMIRYVSLSFPYSPSQEE